jgi:mannan endo-1,6-alpha-mannosidase
VQEQEVLVPNSITAGDRAGAAILTVAILVFFVGGSVWLVLFD